MRNLACTCRFASSALVLLAALPAYAKPDVVFRGMCDASGAVPLSSRSFAVADDEDNILRIYDAEAGGEPTGAYDLSEPLGVLPEKKKKKQKPGLETDVEAATLIGDTALWLTSHGRSRSGEMRPERIRFFGTTAVAPLTLIGTPYDHLLDDLLAHPELVKLGLAQSARIAAKKGGLNLEGMTATPEGKVIIGFRTPVAEKKAIIVLIENPLQMIRGEKAKLGALILLDLGGGGVRSLSWWRGRYLIFASGADETPPSKLFTWKEGEAPRLIPTDFRDVNPEAFFTPEDREEFLVLSDDGHVEVGGKLCKHLKDDSKKTFRGRWMKL
jgi:hypothetical protein